MVSLFAASVTALSQMHGEDAQGNQYAADLQPGLPGAPSEIRLGTVRARTPEEIAECRSAAAARVASAAPPAEPKQTKGKNIDARMLKVMAENVESHGWSARQWAAALRCSDGTV